MIPGARPGVLARLFVYGDPVGSAIVDLNSWAQFFQGSPTLPTAGAVVVVDQPGLTGSLLYIGLNIPLAGRFRVPVAICSQSQAYVPKRAESGHNNELLYINDADGGIGVRRWVPATPRYPRILPGSQPRLQSRVSRI